MIDSVGGASGAESALFQTDALGKEDFLRLLVTQLQYQDPLDPLDAQDFASQLAQFTALEQQVNTNDLIAQQIQMNEASMVEAQNSVAIGLIGTGVVADGDQLVLDGSADASAHFASSGPATVTLTLVDAAGEEVLSRSVSVTGDGIHAVDLGSEAADLPPGQYTLAVEVAAGAEGVTARPLTSGTVQGVRWGESGPVLVVGDAEIPLSNVLEITNTGATQP